VVSGFKIKSFVSPHGLMMIIDDCLEMTLLCLHYDVTDLTHSFSGISDPSGSCLYRRELTSPVVYFVTM